MDDNIDKLLPPIGRWAYHKQSPGTASECLTSSADKVAMMAAPQTPNAFTDFIHVLVLVGLPAGPVNRALSRHAIDSSPDGVMVNVFNDLARLPATAKPWKPRGSRTLSSTCVWPLLRLMRCSSSRATAGEFPRAHNAIDWLTRRWRHGALHDKPLAVVGRSAGRYSGVWSRQIEYTRGGLGPRVIEPLTVPTLREAVKKLADEVHGGSAAAAM